MRIEMGALGHAQRVSACRRLLLRFGPRRGIRAALPSRPVATIAIVVGDWTVSSHFEEIAAALCGSDVMADAKADSVTLAQGLQSMVYRVDVNLKKPSSAQSTFTYGAGYARQSTLFGVAGL